MELSQEHSGSVHQFRAIWGLWIFHLVRGQLANARGLAENLLALAHREQSSDLLIEAHRNLGSTYFFLGQFDQAKSHLLTAQSLYDPNQHRSHAFLYAQDPGITAASYLARTLWILGEVEQAKMLALEVVGMARELEHPFTRVITLVYLSWIYSTFRDTKRTLELTNEAIAVSTQYSFALGLALATTFSRLGVGRKWARGRSRQVTTRDFRYSGSQEAGLNPHVYLGVACGDIFSTQTH